MPLAVPAVPGRLDAANGRYVLDILDRAIAGCKSGEFAGMVTAPVHKGIICEAGVPFSGHTEYLAEATATPLVVMMLVSASACRRRASWSPASTPTRGRAATWAPRRSR